MAVVLVLVALAMIAAGGAAIVQGVPIIVLERGWTLVIAGAVVAGSGAVLAGIGFSLAALRGIERELGRLRERVGRLDAAVPAPTPPAGLSASREAVTTTSASVPAPVASGRPGVAEPVAPGPSGPAVEAVRTRASPPPPALTSPLSVERRTATGGDAGEPAGAVAPNGSDPAEPAESASAAPTVVGTYNSGGNHYVMFSDGSIEAETPNGQFRFQSLDELKAFIASGGEEAGAPAPAA